MILTSEKQYKTDENDLKEGRKKMTICCVKRKKGVIYLHLLYVFQKIAVLCLM